MGLIYVSSESKQLINALRANIASGKEASNQLKKGSQKVISAVDGKTLSGAAYTAGKGLFSELIIPTINKVTSSIDTLETELTTYTSANSKVSGEGTLNEDRLRQKIAEKKAMKKAVDASAAIAKAASRNNSVAKVLDSLLNVQHTLNRLSNTYEQDIRELKKKLEKLQQFSSETSSLFNDSLSNLKLAMQGVTILNNTIVNNDGTYQLPKGVDITWFNTMKTKSETEKISGVYSKGIYGGNQSSPLEAYNSGDNTIIDIIKKYYPNMTDREAKNYLQKLENEGCGYVALINTFLNYYKGSEKEFEKEFGFPLYHVVNGQRIINYNYLIVDFYANQDNHNEEGMLFWKRDTLNKNEDPSDIEGYGTTANMREYRFTNYMSDHGFKVNVINGEGFLGLSKINADIDNYDKYSKTGDIIISVSPIKMVDSLGNEYVSSGGHAMTVTGKTKDGKLIVSSWGEKFYVDPSDYGKNEYNATFQVIEYEK